MLYQAWKRNSFVFLAFSKIKLLQQQNPKFSNDKTFCFRHIYDSKNYYLTRTQASAIVGVSLVT